MTCLFHPRCEWVEDAWSCPWGSGLPTWAAVRLQTLPELSFPLPQTRRNRWTSHQPSWISSCRGQPQVRKRLIPDFRHWISLKAVLLLHCLCLSLCLCCWLLPIPSVCLPDGLSLTCSIFWPQNTASLPSTGRKKKMMMRGSSGLPGQLQCQKTIYFVYKKPITVHFFLLLTQACLHWASSDRQIQTTQDNFERNSWSLQVLTVELTLISF